jgi:hypothetical protein
MKYYMKNYLKNHLVLILALTVLVIATPLLVSGFGIGLAVLWAVWLVALALTLVQDRRTA